MRRLWRQPARARLFQRVFCWLVNSWKLHRGGPVGFGHGKATTDGWSSQESHYSPLTYWFLARSFSGLPKTNSVPDLVELRHKANWAVYGAGGRIYWVGVPI